MTEQDLAEDLATQVHAVAGIVSRKIVQLRQAMLAVIWIQLPLLGLIIIIELGHAAANIAMK
jgi:hypothetical protein